MRSSTAPAAGGKLLPLELEGVSFSAGARLIIDNVSVTLDGEKRSVIVGANGAGKSVLLRLCHGLIPPTRGTIRWSSPESPGTARRQAMVFQRPVLLRRSALANVVYALQVAGAPRRERAQRAREALVKVGLDGLRRHAARVLSGGEQQRLALARAWALRPEVLFLDEPTASLDPGATQEIEGIIRAMHHAGTKIIMVTHSLGQARRMADEILFLHQGRLVERAPAGRFFKYTETTESAQFLVGELPW
jgi:tungstate transport system ATP-binding protein